MADLDIINMSRLPFTRGAAMRTRRVHQGPSAHDTANPVNVMPIK